MKLSEYIAILIGMVPFYILYRSHVPDPTVWQNISAIGVASLLSQIWYKS